MKKSMKVVMTPAHFKKIVRKRFSSELSVLKARCKYREILNHFRYEDEDMINSTSLAYKSKKFSKHLKKIVKKVEAKKDRAKVQLQKRLVKHHTLKDSINETYRYSKKDVHSYSYMGSLSESQKD